MRPEGRYSGVHVASCAFLGRCCAYVKHILGRMYANIGTSLEAPEWQNSLNTIRILSCFRNRAFDASIGLGQLAGPVLGALGQLVGTPGALLGVIGPLFGTYGPSWDPCGTHLRPTCDMLY
jgi:hypothetical protein